MAAAFFAIQPKSITSSAAIWLLAPGNLNELPIGYLIHFLDDERVTPLVTAAFSGKTSPEEQHSVAVFAPRTDRRMAAQLGNYTIHGNRDPLEEHPESAKFLARILIPATSHDKIRADLSDSGMRLSSLFPDLSNLARELTEIEALGPIGEDLESPREA